MKKKGIIVTVVLCAAILTGIGIYAAAQSARHVNFELGQHTRELLDKSAQTSTVANGTAGTDTADDTVVATYKDQPFYLSSLQYWRKIADTALEGEHAEKYSTDRNAINTAIKNTIWLEEAERRGIDPPVEDIEQFISMQKEEYDNGMTEEIDAYCEGAGITLEEYYELIRDSLTRQWTRSAVKEAVGREYCEAHGLEYTTINQPPEIKQAIEDYIDALFEEHLANGDIVYYT